MYIDKLDDIVHELNNAYHETIRLKAVDVKSSTYIDFLDKNNDKDPKFKVGDNIGISQFKKTFLQKVTLKIGLK